MTFRIMQSSDLDGVAHLYSANHPSAPTLGPTAALAQTTIVASNAQAIGGFITLSFHDDGAHAYGVIHVLETTDPAGREALALARGLIAAGVNWMKH